MPENIWLHFPWFPALKFTETADFSNSLKPEQIDGAEDKPIVRQAGERTFNLAGRAYLFNFVLPNFYFHITAADAIPRNNGVPLGKMDYLGDRQTAG